MTAFSVFNNEPDIRTVAAGQTIFSEGEAGDFMYAVLEGEVEIVRQGKPLSTVAAGGLFGEMALIDQQPRAASAIAKSDCRLAVVDDKRLTRVISQNPHFALQLMRVLVERIRHNLES
jgi:CRP-like cAMP-binding protein